MQETEIRLECLKLAHRHDHDAEMVVKRAGEYEKYVTGSSATTPEKGRPPKKKSGQSSDPFS